MSQLTTRNAGSDFDLHQSPQKFGGPKKLYIYEMPYSEKQTLLEILEEEGKSRPNLWIELAERMRVGADHIQVC